MSRLPSRLRFTVCARRSLPHGLRQCSALAEEIGASGIELDLSSWLLRRRLYAAISDAGKWNVPVSALWLPASELNSFLSVANTRARELEAIRSLPLELVIALPEGNEATDDLAAAQGARRAISALPRLARATLAVHASAPEGGRLHLTRLHLLRRMCEEWEVGVGLDLSHRTDVLWEAEAALQIVGSQLTTIRAGSSLIDRASRHGDVHRRALRAAADLGFHGTVALVPQAPWWLRWHTETCRTELAANREVIAGLFQPRGVRTTHPNPLHQH